MGSTSGAEVAAESKAAPARTLGAASGVETTSRSVDSTCWIDSVRACRSVDEAESPRRLKLPQEEQVVHLVQLPAVIPDVDAAQEGGEVCRFARAQAPQEQCPIERPGV